MVLISGQYVSLLSRKSGFYLFFLGFFSWGCTSFSAISIFSPSLNDDKKSSTGTQRY